ncbi:MAG: hypothetical protein HC875_10170 [Anaerolineales bacterium]|nr:hypothetical protein [Anaerolineales bacterium]
MRCKRPTCAGRTGTVRSFAQSIAPLHSRGRSLAGFESKGYFSVSPAGFLFSSQHLPAHRRSLLWSWLRFLFREKGQDSLTAKLFCLDPAPLLAAALERSRATVFFSGTLLPLDYFDRVLTGATTHPKLVLRSPFPSEHLALLIHNGVSTRYTQRANSYEAVAALIEGVCAAQPGNYLVFFPSYAYLTAIAELVRERWPGWQLLIQERGMTEASRDAFLARFAAAQAGTLLGFAVMGGIFGEGIDLVGGAADWGGHCRGGAAAVEPGTGFAQNLLYRK